MDIHTCLPSFVPLSSLPYKWPCPAPLTPLAGPSFSILERPFLYHPQTTCSEGCVEIVFSWPLLQTSRPNSPGRGPGVCFSQLTECTSLWALLWGPHPPGPGTHLDLGLADRAQSASWAAHPSSYLAGVLFALSEASTQHVLLDGFQLEAGLSIFAIE